MMLYNIIRGSGGAVCGISIVILQVTKLPHFIIPSLLQEFCPLISTLSFVQVLLAVPTQALDPSRAHSTGPNPVPSPALANQPLTLRRNKGGWLKKMWFYNTDSD